MYVEVYVRDFLMTKRAMIQLWVKFSIQVCIPIEWFPLQRDNIYTLLPDLTRLTLLSWQLKHDFEGKSFGKKIINMLNHNTFPATSWSHSEFNIFSFKIYNLYQPELMSMNRSILRDGSIRSERSLPWDLLQSSHCALWARNQCWHS